MTDTTLTALIDRARTDPDFRQRAMTDLDGTLTAEGYELSEDELAAARVLHGQAQGMSDDDLVSALSGDVIGHG